MSTSHLLGFTFILSVKRSFTDRAPVNINIHSESSQPQSELLATGAEDCALQHNIVVQGGGSIAFLLVPTRFNPAGLWNELTTSTHKVTSLAFRQPRSQKWAQSFNNMCLPV